LYNPYVYYALEEKGFQRREGDQLSVPAHVFCAGLRHQNDFRATFSIAVSTMKHNLALNEQQKGRSLQIKRNLNEFSLGLHAELLDQIQIQMTTFFPFSNTILAKVKAPKTINVPSHQNKLFLSN
jgi:hypothetical protein